MINKSNKIICQDCGIEYSQKQYYLSRIEGQERMLICEYCFERELANSGSIETTFKKYNIPFITELWNEISESYKGNNTIPQYMKALCLPQYINLKWKDTNWFKDDSKEEINFYDEIIISLRKEAKKLNDKLVIATKENNMNLYISTIKSLRDTLDLISKYDWRLMYSEYNTLLSNKDFDRGKLGNEIKQISIWEQNHDNQIRNHKVWNVVSVLDDVVKETKESGMAIGESLDIIDKLTAQVKIEAENWDKKDK